jgi:uncharacterized SAM-binding protein YcdF (DUF218 family)
MFEIKKVLGPLFSPLPVCLELLIVGVVLLWCTRQQRLGKTFVTMAGLLLALLSSEGFSGRLIHTLEAQYPPLNMSTIQAAFTGGEGDTISWIVVLAGGVTPDPTLPIQLQISHESRVRMLEGIRLYHMIPGSKLVLSGGIGFQLESEATVLSRFAQALGVHKDDVVLETRSRDTKDHPLHVSLIVKNDPFILVTSASHMPRAFRLFAQRGMTPIPAPAGHWEPKKYVWPEYYFPGSKGTRLAEMAFHEYLGLGWAWMRGQI